LENLVTMSRIALRAIVDASRAVMQVYQNEDFVASRKKDGSLVTQADLSSSAVILDYLQKDTIPVIDEESEELSYALRRKYSDIWLVDPLDGTREFVHRTGEFAVNIALVRDGNPILGIIASPVDQTIVLGGKMFGTFLLSFADIENRQKWQLLSGNHTKTARSLICIRSHAPLNEQEQIVLDQLRKTNQVECVQKGSALKFFDLAQGKADFYLRFAPSMEWDIAAGQAILEGLGGEIIDVKTKNKLTYNKKQLINPNFMAKTNYFMQIEENIK